jgi:hypothetical protein
VAPVVSPAAYLRVYEPLAAFPPAERARWERYAARGGVPSRRAGTRRERETALTAIIRPSLDVDTEAAFVHLADGLVFVCPWSTQVRVWQAALAFRDTLPDRVAEAFVPRALADAGERELRRWRASRPGLKVYVQTCTWLVPPPWFVAFDPGERMLVTGRGPERSLVYRTRMGNARRRVARAVTALESLRRISAESPSVDGLVELGRWLEGFHHHSQVELDYDGLVDLVDDDTLRADTSVADLDEAVKALASGQDGVAAAAYDRVLARWRPLRSVESLS